MSGIVDLRRPYRVPMPQDDPEGLRARAPMTKEPEDLKGGLEPGKGRHIRNLPGRKPNGPSDISLDSALDKRQH